MPHGEVSKAFGELTQASLTLTAGDQRRLVREGDRGAQSWMSRDCLVNMREQGGPRARRSHSAGCPGHPTRPRPRGGLARMRDEQKGVGVP